MKTQNKKFINQIQKNINNENKKNGINHIMNIAYINSIDDKKDVFFIIFLMICFGIIALYYYVKRKNKISNNKKDE